MLIDVALVKKLIRSQFPQWRDEVIAPVESSGWDNRTFHLGKELLVRLPSADDYISQVEKEQEWLPIIAEQVTLPIPTPVAKGRSDELFPRPWSVYRWLDGETLINNYDGDLTTIARDLASFLNSLDLVSIKGAPAAGKHNFFRGCSLKHYEDDVQKSLVILGGIVDEAAIRSIWEAATTHEWTDKPVWFHGDVSLGNLLVNNGNLVAVIDFGCSAIGDPACDLAIAWTLFSGNSRKEFKKHRNVDSHTWARGRGWALWKALIVWSGVDSNQSDRHLVENIVRELIADYELEQANN
ncbi:aminoglycoside phosphotransferase family protein [Aliagarivorans marinus]|uniref:aminoglycoside phosphotransferase family protein n=1 Tax=Aliagarivorans marinus TaxID=561965 RepID=UPI00041DE8BD|nr:aminoglycoside phosphotransferase family protein [Aliagarivorans marinus]